jgi:regulator of protease activity HflC (stomatin/prohibitin superfamily)
MDSLLNPTGWIVLVLVVFVLITGIKGLMIVQQAQVKIVERLGKFHKVAHSGINFIVPFVDRIRPLLLSGARNYYVDLREQVRDFEPQPVITRDNVTMNVDTVIYFQITDPAKSIYEITDLGNAIHQLTITTLRNVMGELVLDETLTSRETVNTKLQEVLDEATDKWGVKVNRVELKNIEPPREIQDAMAKQMKAERERRAVVTEAEGSKQAAILRAEGERDAAITEAEGQKRSAILEAEGGAEARLKIAQAEAEAINRVKGELGDTNAANYLIALKYLESLEKISGGQATKVFLPFEASGILGAIGGIREMLSAEEKPSTSGMTQDKITEIRKAHKQRLEDVSRPDSAKKSPPEAERVLCYDEACIGIIENGKCTECGKVA